MAHVTFKKGQPIQSLSGTIGNLTFRTVNGKTFVREKPKYVLPKRPTERDKERYRRSWVLDYCVATIQELEPDTETAIRNRPKIYKRFASLYNKYRDSFPQSRLYIASLLINQYRERYAESLSRLSRDFIETKC